jgi:hypothetical protein
MNSRLWLCVMTGVLVAHVALLVIIANVRNLGKPAPRPSEPNFMTSTLTVVDATGRKVRERSEYTVSTQLADEATLKKLPPPAGAAGVQ